MTSNRLRYFDEIYDFLLKEDDKVEINAEGFKDCEVKNEKVKQNMKNILEIEKKNAVKEFADKVKEHINNKVIEDFDDSESVQYYTIDLDEFETEIDELLKEYE